eukprot:Skav214244  [mRNA]  locus=scaffold2045:128530:129366:+ [translate_table: standard]
MSRRWRCGVLTPPGGSVLEVAVPDVPLASLLQLPALLRQFRQQSWRTEHVPGRSDSSIVPVLPTWARDLLQTLQWDDALVDAFLASLQDPLAAEPDMVDVSEEEATAEACSLHAPAPLPEHTCQTLTQWMFDDNLAVEDYCFGLVWDDACLETEDPVECFSDNEGTAVLAVNPSSSSRAVPPVLQTAAARQKTFKYGSCRVHSCALRPHLNQSGANAGEIFLRCAHWWNRDFQGRRGCWVAHPFRGDEGMLPKSLVSQRQRLKRTLRFQLLHGPQTRG